MKSATEAGIRDETGSLARGQQDVRETGMRVAGAFAAGGRQAASGDLIELMFAGDPLVTVRRVILARQAGSPRRRGLRSAADELQGSNQVPGTDGGSASRKHYAAVERHAAAVEGPDLLAANAPRGAQLRRHASETKCYATSAVSPESFTLSMAVVVTVLPTVALRPRWLCHSVVALDHPLQQPRQRAWPDLGMRRSQGARSRGGYRGRSL